MIALSPLIPKLLVSIQEIALVVLYTYAGYQAWQRRRHTTEKILRNMFLGVVLLAFGITMQGIGINIALLFFWEHHTSFRLLIWQFSLTGFFLGGHLLIRHDYRTLDEMLVRNEEIREEALEETRRGDRE